MRTSISRQIAFVIGSCDVTRSRSAISGNLRMSVRILVFRRRAQSALVGPAGNLLSACVACYITSSDFSSTSLPAQQQQL